VKLHLDNLQSTTIYHYINKKAVLPLVNHSMPQLFFSV